jgi:hypothetical protein
MSELVVLRRFSYRHEAEVSSDDCGALDPALGLVQGARLVVCEDDAARADTLLDSFDARESPVLPDDPTMA